MSAHDEFCGCGDYDCRQCFNEGDRPEHSTGNAWLDESVRALNLPPAQRAALASLLAGAPQRETSTDERTGGGNG